MIIQHNLMAMNANGQFKKINQDKDKSTEKLSSGYRINRAADDAAGLSVSEKMRAQIRGLDKASNNVSDGISLLQVADGGLNETHAVLQRARELAVQAANDTNTASDRAAIQAEIDQITKEIDRIADTTSFNNDIYPLKGGIKANSGVQGFSMADINMHEETYWIINNAADGADQTFNGQVWKHGTAVEVKGIAFKEYINTTLAHGVDFRFNECFDWSRYPNRVIDDYVRNVYDGKYNLTFADIKIDNDGYYYFDSKNYAGRYYFAMKTAGPNKGDMWISANKNQPDNIYMVANSKLYTSTINIQMGAQAYQTMQLEMVDATAVGIGLNSIDVTSHDAASAAIDNIDKAIEKVSAYRSTFGAQQNRLEYARNDIDNTQDNTQAAESRIRDTDMAEEMQSFSVANILSQAAESMITQANSAPNSVLQLLQ